MKIMATSMVEKQVMSADGRKIGWVSNIVVDTKSGEIMHLLVIPDETVDPQEFKLDTQNRIVLAFSKVKSMKDVVVMGPL
ncbi:MAG: PRC-barrel domain-containing protein [Thermoplasmata archaeon]|nr:MAG: PRC-barrel domain-containing protein [Thermoplasmata archaeon]